MPIYRRLPKRGFKNPFRKEYAVINIKDLADFEPGSVIDIAALKLMGKIRTSDTAVKLLAQGDLDKALNVQLDKASQSAVEKIQAAGGTFVVK
jgi:large subunit ribosomal protein L15